MAAETYTVTLQRRPTGRAAVRALRRAGLVPGILYGNSIEPIPIAARALALRPLLTREAHIIHATFEGESTTYECILKDTAFDPVTDVPIHFDLQAVTADRPIEVEISVVLTGTPVGVAKGGVLEHFAHTLRITCLPRLLPERLEVDVSGLDTGHSLHVRDLHVPNVRILEHPETVIATVVAPTVPEGEGAG